MATYVFAWELGQGLGHLVNLRPLVAGLSARGHHVALVLRDLSKAGSVFAAENVSTWQAPFKQNRTHYLGPTLSFPHILYENGFSEAGELGTMCLARICVPNILRSRSLICGKSIFVISVRGPRHWRFPPPRCRSLFPQLL